MIAGFRKPKRNFRKKISAHDDDDDDEQFKVESTKDQIPALDILTSIETESPVSVKKVEKSKERQKTSKSGSKTSGLLSFEDEIHEGEEFQLKKTKESRKLMQKIKDEKKKKKSIKAEGGVNLIGESERRVAQQMKNISVTDDQREDDDDDNDEISGLVQEDQSDEENDNYSNVHSDLSTGIIPDAATIFALKKQRERARTLGTGSDFIPLQTTSKFPKASNSFSKSRLVREEDDDSDDERIEFKGSQKKSFPALERRKEVAKALEDTHDDTDVHKDEDEEIHLWEQQQIKKGASIPASQTEQKYGPTVPPEYGHPGMNAGFQAVYSGVPMYDAQASMMYGFPVQTMPSIGPQGGNTVTVDMVSQRIRERLESLQQVHRAHVLEHDKHKKDIETYKLSTKTLEIKSADVSDRFNYYQEMSGYVRDLLECLNEKMPTINELESSMLQLWRQRSNKYSQRRINDTRDEDSQITGKIPKKDTSLGADEFGRDRGSYEETARQRRIAEREGRRNRRRRNRNKDAEHHEGLSSDDEELDSESARYNADKERILSQGSAIFEDVVSDFSNVDEIKSRFEEWKFGFNDTYKEAYIHLCLPKMFTPFLRLEMLDWNPMQGDNTRLDDMQWYKSLIMYSHHGSDVTADDEDNQLIPRIIERVIVPRLTELVKFVWDPLSRKQNSSLTSLLQKLGDDYPTLQKESKNTKASELMSEIVNKIKQAIDNEMYIPLYPKGLLLNRTTGASAFLERQFWSGYKLLSNIMSWKDLLSIKIIQELGVDSILNRYLIVALQQLSNYQECLEKCKEISNVLPRCLMDGSDSLSRHLQPLARYLSSLACNIFKSSLGYSDMEKKKSKIMIKKCISLLMHLQAFDMARNVAKEYKIDNV
eukprot:gene333-965_t